jgi:hypothetical protein
MASTALLLGALTVGASNVAQFTGNSHALFLDVSIQDWGDGFTRQFFLTTYDGNTNAKPFHIRNGNWITVSGEMKEVDGRYKTDYLLWVSEIDTADFVDWGVLDLAVANDDTNSNNVHDLAEKSQAANVSATGFWRSVTGDQGNATGTFQRSAGNNSGTYHLALTNTAAGTVNITAPFYANSLEGTLTYNVSNKTATLSFVSTAKESSNYAGQSTYAVINDAEFELAATTLFKSGGSVAMPDITFVRTGGTFYTATVVLADGEPITPWIDYQNWTLNITDPNDADNDGIPDISDAHDDLPPTITVDPGLLTYATGADPDLRLGVSATDNIEGNITDQLTITGAVDFGMVGEYVIIYTVQDAAGNEVQAQRTYRIIATDIDGDGIDDLWETENFGGLGFSASANPDGDGLTNLEEYLYNSDPLGPNIVIVVVEGWNLIGVGEDSTITNIDDVAGGIWAYLDGRFTTVTLLTANGGYWIYCFEAGLIVLAQ